VGGRREERADGVLADAAVCLDGHGHLLAATHHGRALLRLPRADVLGLLQIKGALFACAIQTSSSHILVDNLVDHVTEFDRPPARRAPYMARPVP